METIQIQVLWRLWGRLGELPVSLRDDKGTFLLVALLMMFAHGDALDAFIKALTPFWFCRSEKHPAWLAFKVL